MTFEEFEKFLVDNKIGVTFESYVNSKKIELYFTNKDGFEYKYNIEDINLEGINIARNDLSYVWVHLIDTSEFDRVIDGLKHAIYEYNKSNDADITIEEFKEFLEKNHIDIDISLNRYLGILTGKFYIDDYHILETYEVKSGFDSIYGANRDKLIDTYISLLAKKVKLKDVRDVLVSVLAGDSEPDEYEIREDESSTKEDNSAGPIITGTIKIPSIREQTLDTAKKCVMGNREQDYGTPESNFATIASFWSDYLDMDISAQQVADMMILMKISRIKNGGGTGDSYVDIAGYAACGNEILSKKG